MVDEQQSGQGQAPAAKTEQASSQALIALVLGIVGFLFCQPLGIVAWIMGGRERKAIEAGQSPQAGMGIATAGWILGIIDTAIFILTVIILIVVLIFVLAAGTSAIRM